VRECLDPAHGAREAWRITRIRESLDSHGRWALSPGSLDASATPSARADGRVRAIGVSVIS
jgi:hypothetical protein